MTKRLCTPVLAAFLCLFACRKEMYRQGSPTPFLLAGSYISITDSAYGANVNNADNRAAIQKALDHGDSVYFPAGIYKIRGTLNVSSNSTLFGPGTLLMDTAASRAILKVENQNNVVINGLTLDGQSSIVPVSEKNQRGIMHVSKSTNVTMQNLNVKNAYDFGIAVIESFYTTVSGCSVTAFGNMGIYVAFSHNINILSNKMDGGQYTNSSKNLHGVEIWGGSDSALTHGASNITVDRNTVRNVGQGGLWCSATDSITFTNNNVAYCGDVGIDAEFSNQVVIAQDTVSNCINGGITTFYGSKNVQILHNIVTQGIGFGEAVYIHGSHQSSQRSSGITIRGNKLSTQDTMTPVIYTELGWLSNSTIDSNTITAAASAGMLLRGANYLTVTQNQVTVGTANSKSAAIGIGFEGGSNSTIENNTIVSNYDISPPITASTNKGGIHLYWVDGTYNCTNNHVANNKIKGFSASINDNCWQNVSQGNSPSNNYIGYNSVNTIYRRNLPSWQGTIEHNVNIDNPSQAVTPIAY